MDKTPLIIYDNVSKCKTLGWNEKFILSHILSFQIDGKDFHQTDKEMGIELGSSTGQISKYTSRLKKRGEIETRIEFHVPISGGRPIPVRYIVVKNVNKWTETRQQLKDRIIRRLIDEGDCLAEFETKDINELINWIDDLIAFNGKFYLKS